MSSFSQAYGSALAHALNVDTSSAVVSKSALLPSGCAVTHLRRDIADNLLTSPIAKEDAFLVMLQLRDWPKRILWRDGKPANAQPLRKGAISVFDLRESWVGHRVCPIEQMNFYIPRQSLDRFVELEELPAVTDFENDPCLGKDDEVMLRLGLALLPVFDGPTEANGLFVDHVISAAIAHLVDRYTSVGGSRPRAEGLLSAAQERRAKELIDANLSGRVTMRDLAEECGLSTTAFNASFERTVGQTPAAWLAQRRLERAKALLLNSRMSIKQVAAHSGFADHAHMESVFRRVFAMTAAEWRLAQR